MPKKPVLHETFEREDVDLDDTLFVECTFRDCQLVYAGGAPPDLVDCSLDSLRVHFTGAAGETVRLLHHFYHNLGAEGQQMVEQLFDRIRRPPIVA